MGSAAARTQAFECTGTSTYQCIETYSKPPCAFGSFISWKFQNYAAVGTLHAKLDSEPCASTLAHSGPFMMSRYPFSPSMAHVPWVIHELQAYIFHAQNCMDAWKNKLPWGFSDMPSMYAIVQHCYRWWYQACLLKVSWRCSKNLQRNTYICIFPAFACTPEKMYLCVAGQITQTCLAEFRFPGVGGETARCHLWWFICF